MSSGRSAAAAMLAHQVGDASQMTVTIQIPNPSHEAVRALHEMSRAAARSTPSDSESDAGSESDGGDGGDGGAGGLGDKEREELKEKLRNKVFSDSMSDEVTIEGARSKRKAGAKAQQAEESLEEEKKRIRKEKNREAAARCRNKRRLTLDSLEKECADMESEIRDLDGQLQRAQEDIRAMEAELKDHKCMVKA